MHPQGKYSGTERRPSTNCFKCITQLRQGSARCCRIGKRRAADTFDTSSRGEGRIPASQQGLRTTLRNECSTNSSFCRFAANETRNFVQRRDQLWIHERLGTFTNGDPRADVLSLCRRHFEAQPSKGMCLTLWSCLEVEQIHAQLTTMGSVHYISRLGTAIVNAWTIS